MTRPFGDNIRFAFLVLLICLTHSTSLNTFCQTAGSFNARVSGPATAVALEADGNMLISGNLVGTFNNLGYSLVRLTTSGEVKPLLDPSTAQWSKALALQDDGSTLRIGLSSVALDRTTADGVRYPGLVSSVDCLAIQSDGKVLVGSSYSAIAGGTNRVVRLNPDLSLDYSFNAGSMAVAYPYDSAYVTCLAVQPDGRILVGGGFSTVQGQNRSGRVRLLSNGSLDTNFVSGGGPANCLLLQPDGKILQASSVRVGSLQTNVLLRLDPDGRNDTNFSSTIGLPVQCLALQADGKILVAGKISFAAGSESITILRLLTNGVTDTNFNLQVKGPLNSFVSSIMLQPGGEILIAGSFTNIAGQLRTTLGRVSNINPAFESLSYNQSALAWIREGSLPEVWRTRFDICTNGTDWLPLGAGTRISNGWSSSSFSMPANTTVRARGYVAGGSASSSAWFLESSSGPPAFTLQPQDRTNNAQTSATFRAAAVGTPPISFQWYKNGTELEDGANISGCKSPVLTIQNVLHPEQGEYAVVITNVQGAATSRSAFLMVMDPYMSPGYSQTALAGGTVSFAVNVAGSTPISYQWFKNGQPLTDDPHIFAANTPTLTLSNVFGADNGIYSAVASNSFGSASNFFASLSVIDPVIFFHPTNQTANLGESVFLTATVIGTPPLVFEWRQNETNLLNHHSAFLELDNIQGTNAGSYDLMVTNNFGKASSSVAHIEVNLAVPDAFDPWAGQGPNGLISSLAPLPDGRIIVAGDFPGFASGNSTNIAVLSNTGILQPDFSPNPDNAVYSLAVQPDSKLIVGGIFQTLAGQGQRFLGRLNGDASLDASFGTNGDLVQFPIVVQPDGKIIGCNSSLVQRLNSDGTRDPSFSAGTHNGRVNTLALTADGKIVLGGVFSSIDAQPRQNIARLNSDGTLDLTFKAAVTNPPAIPFSPISINAVLVRPDQKIIMAGEFISVNGTSCQNLAWLNPDGTLDSTSQVNGPIESMALQTDGALLIAGDFTSVSGQPRNKIARLGPGGSTFFPFIDNAVSGLALEPNGQLLIAGFFSKVAGQPRSGFARLLNSEPGFQALSVDGSTIYWRRGGTAPEITYASFEASQDGTNWLSLGFGTRTNSGFFIKLNDSNLNSAIRARGAVTGGQNNASSWFVESTLPAIRPLGFISGQFALNVIGSAGQTFVLETSTDLRNWSPLQTNTANSATIFFTDTDSTHNATRFYRAHKLVPD